MECMIIGSFGDEHAPGLRATPKHPLKPGDSYLPGFRQDLETIQSLIGKDSSKTLSYIFFEFPSEEYQRSKGMYLQKIKEFLQGCNTPGGETFSSLGSSSSVLTTCMLLFVTSLYFSCVQP